MRILNHTFGQWMRSLLITFVLFFSSFSAKADIYDDFTVSLLTSDPTEMEVYTAWGHTAVRVRSNDGILDLVYNYGVFSFEDVFKFCVNFVLGRTDYLLAAMPYNLALQEAVELKKVRMREQVLNLDNTQKSALISYLREMSLPRNRVYRYNYFYDNCSTRPRLAIERCVDGKIVYPVVNNTYTYRDFIHQSLSNSPWYDFGIAICLGSPTDEVVSDSMTMFMPMYLYDAMSGAMVVHSDGSQTKLIKEERTLCDSPAASDDSSLFPTPLVLAWILLAAVIAHTVFYYIKHKDDYKWFDTMFFGLYGLLGILVFFLTFISVHPCVFPNWNIFWLHPLLLIIPVMSPRKTRSKILGYTHIGNIILTSIVILGWSFIPQSFHPAFLPMMIASVVRSASYLYRYIYVS